MSVPSFESQRDAWSSPPVDDVGYISSGRLLQLSDDELRHLIETMERTRYTGWRNHGNLWREVLGLDSTTGRTVLDYGCGVGVEALQYARGGNDVVVADIAPSNVHLAQRVLRLDGFDAAGYLIVEEPPFIHDAPQVDVIHCAGVLHHIPNPRSVVEAFHRWLVGGGELRLMMYSDRAWRDITRTEPPDDVTTHPAREVFVRAMDGVGDWADWYDRRRLASRFGEWFSVEEVRYITPNQWFLVAILRKKGM